VTDLFNGSDNGCWIVHRPTLGCEPYERPPDRRHGRQAASSLPLNELQAAAGQAAPIALGYPSTTR